MNRDAAFMELLLNDGRRIGVSEYGIPGGPPVLYCHGFPGSRLEGRLAHEAAVTVGVRLIALDRPGYGLSDIQHGRRIGDWPRDAAAVADAMGIERFAILGVSGGAPYALACAALLPRRTTATGIVAGLGRMERAEDRSGFNRFARASFWLAQAAPRLSRKFNCALAPVLRNRMNWVLALLAARLPPSDRAVIAEPVIYGMLAASLREAFRQGGQGAAAELILYVTAWDFDTRTIESPCFLWHGGQDTTVPVSVGRRMAATIPGCRAEFYPNEGHFSLPLGHMGSILSVLAEHR